MARFFSLLLLSLSAAVAAGCGGQTVSDPRLYYLKAPTQRIFDYELTCNDGSLVTGTITLDVLRVDWPASSKDVYSMRIHRTADFKAHFIGRQCAIGHAARDVIKRSIEPDNVPEVFASDGYHPERIRSLKLPLDYTAWDKYDVDAQLTGSMSDPAQLALVWFKAMTDELTFPKPQLDVVNVQEDHSTAIYDLHVRSDGRPHGVFTCQFARDRGLVGATGAWRTGRA